MGLDVRGHGGYIVLAPSIHPDTGRRYEWTGELLPPDELPRFSPAWMSPATRALVALRASLGGKFREGDLRHFNRLLLDFLTLVDSVRWRSRDPRSTHLSVLANKG